MTIAEQLEQLFRDDDQSAAWHVRAPAQMWNALGPLATQAPDIAVDLGPPATTLAAFGAAVPDELADTWMRVGPMQCTTGEHTYRWLGVTELVERRDELRARVRKSLRKSRPTIDVLATLDDQPLLLFDAHQRSSGDVWYHKADGEPYHVLSWLIAVHINLPILRALTTRIGDAFRLEVGQAPGPATQRSRLIKEAKYFEAIVDDRQLLTRTAKLGQPGKPKIATAPSADKAAALYDKAIAAAKSKGFT